MMAWSGFLKGCVRCLLRLASLTPRMVVRCDKGGFTLASQAAASHIRVHDKSHYIDQLCMTASSIICDYILFAVRFAKATIPRMFETADT